LLIEVPDCSRLKKVPAGFEFLNLMQIYANEGFG
jgi:hypothetical protein